MRFSKVRKGFRFREIFIVLCCILFFAGGLASFSLQAQKVESVYFSEFTTGNTIYVITNRQQAAFEYSLNFENAVRQDGQLDFLKVQFVQPDSIFTERLYIDDFLNQISKVQSDWLLFVHGDSKTFEQAVMRGFDIQYLHNVPVLVFSWPTKDPVLNGIKNFKNSKKNIVLSMNYFVNLLQFMSVFRENNGFFADSSHLTLFCHSLGNAFMEQLVKDKRIKEFGFKIFDNVVLNSAAVNQQNHKDWIEQINLQQQIYITSNKSDFNLKGVRIFTKDGKQLGEKVELPLAKNANYIQFTNAVGFRTPTGTTHTFFIGEVPEKSKNIKEFYYDLFHGKQIDFSDSTRFHNNKHSLGYDIIF